MQEGFTRFGIFAEPEFWNAAECNRLIALAKAGTLEEAGVYSEGKLGVDDRYRKTGRIRIHSNLSAEIHNSLLSMKQRLQSYYGIHLAGLQPFQFLQYRPGDYFRTHQDERRSASELTRKVSLVVFLNEDYAGGELVFYEDMEHNLAGDGFCVTAKPGMLVAFSSYLLHEVREVTSGMRYSIVSWFL